jgi:hypothetical protein
VSDMKALEQLKELQQLTLYPGGSLVTNLAPVRELTSLQTLSIVNATRTQRMSLRNVPASLVELAF